LVAIPFARASSCGGLYSRSSKASALRSLTPSPHSLSLVHLVLPRIAYRLSRMVFSHY
jgi:hypothetical protein